MPAACWNPDNWRAFPNQETQGESFLTARVYCWLDFIRLIAKTYYLVLGIHWICSSSVSLGFDEEWKQHFFCVKIWNKELWNTLGNGTAGSSCVPGQVRKEAVTRKCSASVTAAVTAPQRKRAGGAGPSWPHCWACKHGGSTLAPAGKHLAQILTTELSQLPEVVGDWLRHTPIFRSGQPVP